MGKMRVLIVGNVAYDHLARFVYHITHSDANIQLDVFNVGSREKKYSEKFDKCTIINRFHYFPSIFYKIKYVRGLCCKIDNYIALSKILTPYDILDVHFVSTYPILYRDLSKITKRLMLSPWGSDVYRISEEKRKQLQPIYDKADFVSLPKIQFCRDTCQKFNIPESKLVDLGFGSDAIDYIMSHRDVTREDAKAKLNLQGRYIISCGYNGSTAQNHLKIIEAISQIKEKLPEKLTLLFPMTYSLTADYLVKVKDALEEHSMDYRIFDSYLSEEDLFNLRKCSDMFIHAQPTDAASGSIQEYILCGCKVLNGKWTRYPQLEEHGVPYCIFNDFNELGEKILEVMKGNIDVKEETLVYISTKAWSYMAKGWTAFFESLGK